MNQIQAIKNAMSFLTLVAIDGDVELDEFDDILNDLYETDVDIEIIKHFLILMYEIV